MIFIINYAQRCIIRFIKSHKVLNLVSENNLEPGTGKVASRVTITDFLVFAALILTISALYQPPRLSGIWVLWLTNTFMPTSNLSNL